MDLTRPAGCFLQFLSIPCFIGGGVLAFGRQEFSLSPVVIGLGIMAAACWMLIAGGRPGRDAASARRNAAKD